MIFSCGKNERKLNIIKFLYFNFLKIFPYIQVKKNKWNEFKFIFKDNLLI